uniref:Uncharacterized protein n=1 Tax=Opuntia streptacantha TaxID=393608 RepID=A0A7C9DYH3_OPUST
MYLHKSPHRAEKTRAQGGGGGAQREAAHRGRRHRERQIGGGGGTDKGGTDKGAQREAAPRPAHINRRPQGAGGGHSEPAAATVRVRVLVCGGKMEVAWCGGMAWRDGFEECHVIN